MIDKRTMPFEEWKSRCNTLFDNKYDYTNSVYKGMKHPITISCPIHGEFTQKAHSHYLGHHCAKCNGSLKISNDDIILQFKQRIQVVSEKYILMWTSFHVK